MATPTTVKEEARKAIEQLDDNATWEDVIYTMYIHEKRARGLADSRAGRTATLEEVRRRFGIGQR